MICEGPTDTAAMLDLEFSMLSVVQVALAAASLLLALDPADG